MVISVFTLIFIVMFTIESLLTDRLHGKPKQLFASISLLLAELANGLATAFQSAPGESCTVGNRAR